MIFLRELTNALMAIVANINAAPNFVRVVLSAFCSSHFLAKSMSQMEIEIFMLFWDKVVNEHCPKLTSIQTII